MWHKFLVGLAWYGIYCLVCTALGLLWLDYRLWKLNHKRNRGLQ